MTTLCRFAPSPTGFLHVGNIRAAIINYLYAKKTGGKFMLRLDDTDIERVKDEYRDMIIQDMKWLGLDYDIFIKQSDRIKRYEEAKLLLIKTGRLYECYESEGELNLVRKSQVASGIAPIYNRASLNLNQEQKTNFINSGIKPYYRFLLKDKNVSWNDKIKGNIEYQGLHFSDPVLIRDNNVATYTFCSVVDDLDYGVTDIIRGEDHITNTAIQIQIFEALIEAGFKGFIPEFAHLSLVKAKEGKISKREGGFDIKTLRSQKILPFAIISLLAQIGTSKSIEIHKDYNKLIEFFDFSIFSKSSTSYDIQELIVINQKLLQSLNFDEISKERDGESLSEINENIWLAIRSNINSLDDIKYWIEVFKSNFRFNNGINDKEFLKKSLETLPQDTSSENAWQLWLDEIKKDTNRKGKDLFMPIRLALTGQEHGPELKNVINLLSRDEIIARLSN